MSGFQGLRTSGTVVGEWVAEAICAGLDVAVFYPERGETVPAVKAICNGCPVRVPCRDHALEHRENFGIWGGLSQNDRKAIRRERRKAATRKAA